MISSAVVIPERNSPPRSPSPSLKRRLSSFTSDTNKRPRLETRESTDSNRQHDMPPSPRVAMSPPRRRSAIGAGAVEEKKRGQRLFGALLGTLSQTSGSKTAHKKRDEMAQKQRDRARKETEEREEELRRKKAELDKVRRAEQSVWDEESMRLRHRNMRATSHFLRTKSEPTLYYKPWDLRPEEKDLIEQQVKDVEAIIRKEVGEDHAPPEHGALDHEMEDESVASGTNANGKLEADDATMTETGVTNGIGEQEKEVTENGSQRHHSDVMDAKMSPTQPEKAKDDDQGGDELVEGQEDDVIY